MIDVCRGSSASRVAKAVLVELDPVLAERAVDAASDLAMVEVRCADASDVAVYADVMPVDVLLMCGILGNVDPEAIGGIIRRSTHLLRDGGHVIWTRGGGDPDRRAQVRALFEANGFDEVAFDGAPERFGVGVSRLAARPEGGEDGPLFSFVR